MKKPPRTYTKAEVTAITDALHTRLGIKHREELGRMYRERYNEGFADGQASAQDDMRQALGLERKQT